MRATEESTENVTRVYRPDIDGLRAIAVLAVIAYHVSPNLVGGGFVGVDVFFVISGFLITGIISREMKAGTFSLAHFYTRRVRRIFPSLTITLTACLVFGALFLYPFELESLSKQSLAATAFSANIYYWMTSDYFGTSSNQLALLHLWTLGLEEQYYLIWPLALLAFRMTRIRTSLLVLAAFLVSFAINIKYYRWSPEWVFFLPPARFWELFAGSALAVFMGAEDVRARKAAALRESVALCGTATLVLSLFFTSEVGFPGWQAMAPVLGTTMLIAAGPHTYTARKLLSNQLMIGIGLISYPLYLFHWPLLVFARTTVTDEYPWVVAGGAILLSAILAVITYKFVESPMRKSTSMRTLASLIFAMVTIAIVSFLVMRGHINGRINSAEVAIVEAAINDWAMQVDNYGKHDNFSLIELGSAPKKILIFGDSHASQYYSWFRKNLSNIEDSGLSVQVAAYGGCPPLPFVNRREGGYGCPQFYDYVIEHAKSADVTTIVISAWWEHYFGFRYGISSATTLLDVGLDGIGPSIDELANDMEDLVEEGKNVIVLLSNPTSPNFDPKNMISRTTGEITAAEVSRAAFKEYVYPVSRIIEEAVRRSGAIVIDPTEYLCEGDVCPSLSRGGLPIYKDDHHLRSTFAEQEADFLWEIVNRSR